MSFFDSYRHASASAFVSEMFFGRSEPGTFTKQKPVAVAVKSTMASANDGSQWFWAPPATLHDTIPKPIVPRIP